MSEDQGTPKAGANDGSAADPGRERWRSTTRAKALARSPERQERFLTTSGVEVKDLYTPADVAGLDQDRDLGRPGEYPYTRGVQPTMYRGRLWTMRQYAGFSTAEETNRRFRYLLEQGQTGLSVAIAGTATQVLNRLGIYDVDPATANAVGSQLTAQGRMAMAVGCPVSSSSAACCAATICRKSNPFGTVITFQSCR